jgi:hypothetical protein
MRPGEWIAVGAVVLLLLLAPPLEAPAANWLQKGLEMFGGSQAENAAPLSTAEIAAGLKDALRVGTGRVVDRLGAVDGFNKDPKVHIPLPNGLEKARKRLAVVGMGGMFEDLELKMNRAAEDAAPEARALFVSAIEQMTLEDARAIYDGPEDAATQYFRGKMSAPLREKMQPLVTQSLAEVGAVQAYEAALGKYRTLPFVPDVKTDLAGYVTDKGLEGIFFYLAREEAAIRQDPAKRTTELLRRVFGKRP